MNSARFGFALTTLCLIVPISPAASADLSLEINAPPRISMTHVMPGTKQLPRGVTTQTTLAGCREAGDPVVRTIAGGVEVTRQLVHTADNNRCTLIERLLPSKDSVRWEVEIRGAAGPWTTDIITRLTFPDTHVSGTLRVPTTNGTRSVPDTLFWTAWSDPEQRGGAWRDPLVLQPFADRTWNYNGGPSEANLVAVPIATIVEPKNDVGLSLVLSPEDTLLDLRLTTTAGGEVAWTRSKYRIFAEKPLRFTMDLVPHEADWRGGLAWMVNRYPDFFNPPNLKADFMAGCGAYSADERHFNTVNLRRMAFRVNWKCSEDFPYMGMFLPPLTDDRATWVRGTDEPPIPGKSALNSFQSLNDYSRWMREQRFYVLNYFNVTEFGRNMRWPAPPRTTASEADLWKDPNDYLYAKHADALLLAGGRPRDTCYHAFIMDVGNPGYQKFMLEQAQRHIERLPVSSGICIDRTDWLRQYNSRADDGVSWVNGKPARSLYLSWRDFMAKLGPLMHAAGKVIYVNTLTKRLELLRHVDGIYDEYGQTPTALNTSALMALRKPLMCWTPGANDLRPDPDAFFQRHLHLGAYPTALYPGNNHCIQPDAWAEKYYLDYGPLFDAIRGKKWVLHPHAVEVVGQKAKANLFEVPGGYVVPVTFGGKEATVKVVLHGLPRLAGQTGFRMEVLHPGEERWTLLAAGSLHPEGISAISPGSRSAPGVVDVKQFPTPEGSKPVRAATPPGSRYISCNTTGGALRDPRLIAETPPGSRHDLTLEVPLSRGCAMVKLSYAWINPTESWFCETTSIEMGTTIDGGELHYTLDGSEPTAASPRYTEPLKIDKTTDVHAAVFVVGRQIGQTVTAEFVRLPPPPPEIAPVGRIFDESTGVTLSLPPGIKSAPIHYTLDGSTPMGNSPRYSKPIRLTKTTTVKAAVFLRDSQSDAASATFSCRGPKPPLPQVRLAGLTPLRATAGWGGPPKMDRSIQDRPLAIAGTAYEHGIGTHAVSELVYVLKPEFRRFVAVVGIDDEMRDYPQGSVVFEVWIDGRRAGQSPVMHVGDVAYLDVEIPAGSKRIRLVAGDAGDGINADHADWANAGFLPR
jgi:hypothetical protein